MWDSEIIPDEDILYYRIHKNFIVEGELSPGVFRNGGQAAMSTDWSKYSSAEETKNRVRDNNKDPDNYGVVEFSTGQVRGIPQEVTHTPSRNNQAHTSVSGEKSPEARLKFMEIYEWSIPL